ncbi:unnamed protein product [Sphenostylis stenocarpa]|uniref:Uncharacterized protein n=1 Tax=Sphenostylis stenocarpa TaxID=92480 RepID=A0AA86RZF2_9FABA|nr:unnamed protein product [Sphenostylis stenocarpa]
MRVHGTLLQLHRHFQVGGLHSHTSHFAHVISNPCGTLLNTRQPPTCQAVGLTNQKLTFGIVRETVASHVGLSKSGFRTPAKRRLVVLFGFDKSKAHETNNSLTLKQSNKRQHESCVPLDQIVAGRAMLWLILLQSEDKAN